ncbi:MAG: DUF3859 domain-containing protein [Pseudomonadales bacterium]|nr:DUF3859 domain-containing protein [Pseudomonadales bacterium]
MSAREPVAGATIEDYGVFDVKTRGGGNQVDYVVAAKGIARTDKVPAKLGTTFGIYYTVNGPRRGTSVVVTEIFRMPQPGIPEGAEHVMQKAVKARVQTGHSQFTSFGFDTEDEIIEGDWAIEVWYRDQKLASRTFHVSRSNSVTGEPGSDFTCAEGATPIIGSHMPRLRCSSNRVD